jgi:hypothetical protein
LLRAWPTWYHSRRNCGPCQLLALFLRTGIHPCTATESFSGQPFLRSRSRYRQFYKQDPKNWVHNYLSLNDLAKSSDEFQMMFVEDDKVFVNWHHRVLCDLLKPQGTAQDAALQSV